MRQSEIKAKQQKNQNLIMLVLVIASGMLVSCSLAPKSSTGTDSASSSPTPKLTKVDVKIASLGYLSSLGQYRGTTLPAREVSWRSQTEGTLLDLAIRVGDRVERGQSIGKLDDRLLSTDVAGRTAELSALESELAQAKIQVNNAQIRLEEAEIELEQANSEALRYQNLAETGLIAQQQAESFATAARIAEKAVLTAREAVKLEEQAVAIVRGRIATQRSAIAESQQRQAYSQIVAPIGGIVTTKTKDSGSLIRAGEEVVTIGDFSQIKINIPLSELDLGKVSLGQQVKVNFDAFGDRAFTGRVSRIAPTANAASRQIPIEVTVDNSEGQIKGGLLARVNFVQKQESRIILSESAVTEENDTNYVFIVPQNSSNQSNVTRRKVLLGDRANGKVEVVAGISPGEKYVSRSSNPLQDRARVGLSIISE